MAHGLSICSYVIRRIDLESLRRLGFIRRPPKKTKKPERNRLISGGKRDKGRDIHTFSESCRHQLSIPMLISPGSCLYREILAILTAESRRGNRKANVDQNAAFGQIVSFLLSRIFRLYFVGRKSTKFCFE
jgi:hypothetical protein